MKAVLQDFRTGELTVSEVPPPGLRSGGILVRNAASAVSAGTERAVVGLAKMNSLQKARARPDLVRKVLKLVAQEGMLSAAQTVLSLAGAPLPLGYSCSGSVHAVGAGVAGFHPGDRVACAGAGHANHAEMLFVPKNLAVLVPHEVDFDEASFSTIGAIAVHGVRQAEVSVGDCVAIIGLGLVGQLTAQICSAAGCRVFGIDVDPAKVSLARDLGAGGGQSQKDGDVIAAMRRYSRDRGADAVIITAATPSSQPVEMAAELARDRAKIVALGDTGLNIPRRTYYEKELDLRLSRSYGPGRYDIQYEEKGQDYPIGYVRWTENRNIEAFLDLAAQRKVQIKPLITHRFPIERAMEAYALLTGESKEPYVGIVLEYENAVPTATTVTLKAPTESQPSARAKAGQTVHFGIIGAGQFAQGVLLPRLRKIEGTQITGVTTGSGLAARKVAEKYGSSFCTSDYREMLARDEIDAVIIATRHNLHADMVVKALAAGKHVFVEKPLALSEDELRSVVAAHEKFSESSNGQSMPILMVGYNRRFSSLAAELKRVFKERPLVMNTRVNAGPLPPNSWVTDPEIGGGRIVGEVCHFIDFMQFLTGSDPIEVFSWAAGNQTDLKSSSDSVCIQIRFADGSLGSITYVDNGDPAFPKERIEIFGGGHAGVISNWRALEITSHGKRTVKRSFLASAKGHAEELAAFVRGVRSVEAPISFRSLVLTTEATFAVQSSLMLERPVRVVLPVAREKDEVQAS